MTADQAFAAACRLAVHDPLPLPGSGATAQRFTRLRSIARRDMAIGRVVEAHADALAIAAELGTSITDPDAVYGVWAASGPEPIVVTADAHASGRDASGGARQRLTGVVPWCGGVTVVDRALVIADHDGRPQVFDVAVADGVAEPSDLPWVSTAFASIGTTAMRFDRAPAVLLGGPAGSGYIDRPGFWHGAIGVAACWAGGLDAVLDAHLAVWRRDDAHSLAHLGAVDAELGVIDAVLERAAREIDQQALDAPDDVAVAERRARRVRSAVERAATRAIDHLQVGAGPWPLAHDRAVNQRTTELTMALRQCHGERDLEPLGASLLRR